MTGKRAIKVKDIVNDIRVRMTDSELMEKYNISLKNLQTISRKLEEVKAIRTSELYGRPTRGDGTVDVDQARKELRQYVDVPITVFEAGAPQAKGIVRDLSKMGLGIKGIRAAERETKTLVISPEQWFPIDALSCDAVCRWTGREGANRDHVSGFEIVTIPRENLGRLQELIDKLSF